MSKIPETGAPHIFGRSNSSRMIQRIQSLYILLAIVVLGAWSFVSVGKFAWTDGELIVMPMRTVLNDVSSGMPKYGWLGISLAIILFAVFMMQLMAFKNRKSQLKLGRLALVLVLLLVMTQYLLLSGNEPNLPDGRAIRLIGVGFYLPPVMLVLVFLAQRAIRSDEELVKSLDRIR